MTVPSRKRRRSQAFTTSESEQDESNSIATTQEIKDESTATLDKEAQVWDAFREEHFEAVEQMPLTLHRQFTLMRELDEQSHGYSVQLLPLLHSYVRHRRGIANGSKSDTFPENGRPTTPEASQTHTGMNIAAATYTNAEKLTPQKRLQFESTSLPRTPTPMNVPQEREALPQTTRQMLSHIAWLSEELLRASEEKVNLAKAADDSVARHIRLLDQAIREQEASITVGMRPGTHPAAIMLPELVVPRIPRRTRTAASPVAGLSGGSEDESRTNAVASTSAAAAAPRRRGRKGRPKMSRPPEATLGPPVLSGHRSLKSTVPPPPAADSSEIQKPYCFCHQSSYGQMIACDDDFCKLEWFHLGCVGLTENPTEEKWYCRNCLQRRSKKRI